MKYKRVYYILYVYAKSRKMYDDIWQIPIIKLCVVHRVVYNTYYIILLARVIKSAKYNLLKH